MIKFLISKLNKIADEGHTSELIAALFHGCFVVLYIGTILFHLSAAVRHARLVSLEEEIRFQSKGKLH